MILQVGSRGRQGSMGLGVIQGTIRVSLRDLYGFRVKGFRVLGFGVQGTGL